LSYLYQFGIAVIIATLCLEIQSNKRQLLPRATWGAR